MFWGASLKAKFILGLVVLILISSFCLYRLDHLNSIPTTPSNFSWINKTEIYVLGLAIGVIGYPIYPEVAREHLMMYRPFSDNPKAQLRLAYMLSAGEFVKKDEEAALVWVEKAKNSKVIKSDRIAGI
jgi:TPR repeat protein